MPDANVDLDDTDDLDTDDVDAVTDSDGVVETGEVEPMEGHDQVASDSATRRVNPPKDKGLLLACFVIACGLFAIIWGTTSAITGDDGRDRPDAIEDISPVENAQQVFQQQQVRVDLQAGYEAVLIIDGIELEVTNIAPVAVEPESNGQQVSIPPTAVYDPGNAIITFRPSDDAAITSFSEGRHEVQVVFWRFDEGRGSARSYRWSFDVV